MQIVADVVVGLNLVPLLAFQLISFDVHFYHHVVENEGSINDVFDFVLTP